MSSRNSKILFKLAGLTGILALCLMVIGLLLRNPVFVQPLGKPVTGDKAEKLEQFLREHLNFLVRQSKNRNYQNLESLNKAASYIEDSFGNHCDRVERQTYQAEGSE